MKLELVDFGALANDKWPKRAHDYDAGADVYIMKDIVIWPGTTENIPLGFGFKALPPLTMAVIKPRSSLARAGLLCHETPIDSDYTGETHAQITNTTAEAYQFKAGDRLGQLVIQPVILAEFVAAGKVNRRSANGLGSTGR